MAVMGAWNLKHGQKLNGAKWFGKVCTATLFLLLLVLVVFMDSSKDGGFFIIGGDGHHVSDADSLSAEFQKLHKKWERRPL